MRTFKIGQKMSNENFRRLVKWKQVMKTTRKNLLGSTKPHRKKNRNLKTFQKYFSATPGIKNDQTFSYISRVFSK